MKSQQAWDFAQDYSSSLMVKLFTGYLVWQMLTTFCGLFFLKNHLETVALINILTIVPLLIIMIIKTEWQLKEKFGD